MERTVSAKRALMAIITELSAWEDRGDVKKIGVTRWSQHAIDKIGEVGQEPTK